jgi:hypothetical protein
MRERPRVDEGRLAARLYAAAELADVLAGHLQARSWPDPSPDYVPVAHLGLTSGYLFRAAKTLDWLPLDQRPGRGRRALLVLSIGSLVGTLAIATALSIWVPTATVGYAVAAGLAGYWMLYDLVQRVRARVALPGSAGTDPDDQFDKLIAEINSLAVELQPEINRHRRDATVDVRAAIGELVIALETFPDP